MSVGFFGIQFGFALQNANASRIFETLGAAIDDIPILWIAAPLTGLLVQPIIGYLSDRTWTRFGRRRPYFFIGAVLTTAALFIFPNSTVLWFAAIGLWLLDISINITMEPFRAFVGDNLPHEQRTLGYATQSLLIGIGAVIASLLPYLMTELGVANTAPPDMIPDSVKYSFYIGGAILFLAVAWTVFSSREYTNEELDNFSRADEADAKAKAATNTNTASSTTAKAATATDEVASATAMESAATNTASSTTAKAATNATDVLSSTATKATTVTDEVASTTAKAATATDEVASATAMESVATDTASSTTAKAATNTNTASSATAKAATTTDVLSTTTTAEPMRQHPFLRYAAVSFVSGLALAAVFYYYELKQELYILAFGACAFSVLLAVSHALQTSGRRNSGLFEMMDALFMMPLTMRRLAVTQFFAWFALFAMWIYTTSTVARQHYNASPDDSALYNEAGNLVGQLFATYNGVAALAALTIPLLSIYLGRKLVFALFLMCGALGLLSFLWVEEASQLYISMCGIGLMWAAVLSIPYAMLSSALPHRRMGLYMGVFNFFIVLPQILAASILGFLISTFFDSDPVYALMLGGLALFVAAASLYLVPDPRGERGKLFN